MASFTLDQLQKLEDAIAQGALRVKYQDKEVEYRNLNEMLQTRELMRKQLKLAPSAAQSRRKTSFSKGFK